MPDISVDTAKVRDRLIDSYYELSSLEQLMVQLFSVIYEPISRASFVLCLNQVGAQDKNGKLFTATTLKPFIDRLLELGLLVQGGGLGPQCHPLLTEVATRDAVRVRRFETLAKVVQERLPVSTRWKGGPRYFTGRRQLMREVRIGIYRQDFKFINQQLEDYAKYNYAKDPFLIDEIYQEICNNPFDPEWFRTLPKEIYESALVSILNDSMLNLVPANEAFGLLQESAAKVGKLDSVLLPVLLIEQLMLRGRLPEADREVERISNLYSNNFDPLRGWLEFLRGENGPAIAHYTSGLQALKKGTGKKKIFFHAMGGLFFVLALLKEGSRDRLNEAVTYAKLSRESKHWLSPTYGVLESVIKIQQGDLSQKE
ncbi:MAG: ATP-dependent helicase, partial [Kovacikia sp.]